MKTAGEQLLRDPDVQPSGDVIAQALGEANNAYVAFINQLARRDIQPAWRYYFDGKAWLAKGLYKWTGARGGQNETTVFWLSIWDGFFKVSLFMPERFRAEALRLPIDDKVKLMIANSKQMGKLTYFPIVFDLRSEDLFEGLFALAELRKRIK